MENGTFSTAFPKAAFILYFGIFLWYSGFFFWILRQYELISCLLHRVIVYGATTLHPVTLAADWRKGSIARPKDFVPGAFPDDAWSDEPLLQLVEDGDAAACSAEQPAKSPGRSSTKANGALTPPRCPWPSVSGAEKRRYPAPPIRYIIRQYLRPIQPNRLVHQRAVKYAPPTLPVHAIEAPLETFPVGPLTRFTTWKVTPSIALSMTDDEIACGTWNSQCLQYYHDDAMRLFVFCSSWTQRLYKPIRMPAESVQEPAFMDRTAIVDEMNWKAAQPPMPMSTILEGAMQLDALNLLPSTVPEADMVEIDTPPPSAAPEIDVDSKQLPDTTASEAEVNPPPTVPAPETNADDNPLLGMTVPKAQTMVKEWAQSWYGKAETIRSYVKDPKEAVSWKRVENWLDLRHAAEEVRKQVEWACQWAWEGDRADHKLSEQFRRTFFPVNRRSEFNDLLGLFNNGAKKLDGNSVIHPVFKNAAKELRNFNQLLIGKHTGGV